MAEARDLYETFRKERGKDGTQMVPWDRLDGATKVYWEAVARKAKEDER